MFRRLFLTVVCSLILAATSWAGSQGQPSYALYVTTNAQELYTVDLHTGQLVFVGPCTADSLTFDPIHDVLYGRDVYTHRFCIVDRQTGQTTLAGISLVGGMVYSHRTGRFYNTVDQVGDNVHQTWLVAYPMKDGLPNWDGDYNHFEFIGYLGTTRYAIGRLTVDDAGFLWGAPIAGGPDNDQGFVAAWDPINAAMVHKSELTDHGYPYLAIHPENGRIYAIDDRYFLHVQGNFATVNAHTGQETLVIGTFVLPSFSSFVFAQAK
jgi:hypothetical protein